MPRNILIYKGLCLFIGLLLSNQARADSDPAIHDFALLIEHSDMQWSYPGVSRDTTTTRLLAVWHESWGQFLKGGLRLAYLDVSQAANPLPSGQNATGYGLGFDLHTALLERHLLQLGLRFTYDYQSSRGKSPDQLSDFVWHTADIGVDIVVAPASRLAFLTGLSLTWLDGEQRVSGNINQIIPFNEAEPFGYYAGLRLKTDATGSIGLKYYGGARQGGEFIFQRRF